MTNFSLRKGLVGLTIATLSFSAASAMAADASAPASASFVVKSAADGNIRSAAKAFKKGEFAQSASYSRIALKSNLSDRRAAIAQSNLCAAYAAMGDMDDAKAACDAAIELRADYAPAIANKTALTVKLAEK